MCENQREPLLRPGLLQNQQFPVKKTNTVFSFQQLKQSKGAGADGDKQAAGAER